MSRPTPHGNSRPVIDRFLEKVETTESCWLWRGFVDPGGYGHIWYSGRPWRAHRVAYELYVGPIPEGLQLDHLCRVRHCVNPAHLEPVTFQENIRRSPIAINRIHAAKTHCIRGHEFTPENTRLNSKGYRACRTCKRVDSRRRRQEGRK